MQGPWSPSLLSPCRLHEAAGRTGATSTTVRKWQVQLGQEAWRADPDRPFTAAGFTTWFRKRCLEAGLSQPSARLRKAAATRAAEKGATTSEPMGIFGWRNISPAKIYTRAAERARLAGRAAHCLEPTGAKSFPLQRYPPTKWE